MSHRFVNQLTDRENVQQVFLVVEKQLRANRNGNLYLQLRLIDRSGSIVGMLWNANEDLYQSFESGDYVQITGTTQFHNGALQIILTKIRGANRDDVDESNYVRLSGQEIDRLAAQAAERLRSMEDLHLRNVAECCIIDETLMSQFCRAPAGIKNHHAYHGGLLEHTVKIMELVDVVAPLYPEINKDLLILGAFLHDIGKIRELNFDKDMSYSDEGQMIGHVVLGVEILDDKIREAEELMGESVPLDLKNQLKHIVVSHQGTYEFGSPKLPMTLEAIVVHLLDTLDSKVQNALTLIDEDANSESNWTVYFPGIGRKLYKTSPGLK